MALCTQSRISQCVPFSMHTVQNSINIFQRSKSESPDTLVVKYSTIITDWKFGKVEYSTWDAKF